MIEFILALSGIALIPVILMYPAIFGKKRPAFTDNRRNENIAIARQRISEIESREANSTAEQSIDPSIDLKVSLLRDLDHNDPNPQRTLKAGWGVFLLVILLTGSGLIYSHLGSPELIYPEVTTQSAAEGSDQEVSLESLLAELEVKLANDPENPKAQELAGRIYMGMQQYAKAEASYAALNSLVPGNADFLAAWADATVMANNNVYTPEAQTIVQQSLSLDPNNINALWISALGSQSLGEHESSLEYLRKLRPLIENDPDSLAHVDILIKRNSEQAKSVSDPQKSAVESRKITVTVSIPEDIREKFSGSHTVFVYARAVSGPKMPLAIKKLRLLDLPATVILDENDAMMPEMTISKFDELEVVARVSRTGDALPGPGDYSSEPEQITRSHSSVVELEILNEVQ